MKKDTEKYLKENLKGFRVEARKIMTGGWTILNPILFLEFKDGSEMRFYDPEMNLEKWEDAQWEK